MKTSSVSVLVDDSLRAMRKLAVGDEIERTLLSSTSGPAPR